MNNKHKVKNSEEEEINDIELDSEDMDDFVEDSYDGYSDYDEERRLGPVVFYTILVLFLITASLLAGFVVFLK